MGGGSLAQHYAKDSPHESKPFPQVRLEPLLREIASAEDKAQVLYNHLPQSFEQDEAGLTAIVHDRATEVDIRMRAKFLVGADGGKTVGPAVGTVMTGATDFAHMVTVYFRAGPVAVLDDDYSITTWELRKAGRGPAPCWGNWERTNSAGIVRSGCSTSAFVPTIPSASWRHRSCEIARVLKIPDLNPDIIGIGHWRSKVC